MSTSNAGLTFDCKAASRSGPHRIFPNRFEVHLPFTWDERSSVVTPDEDIFYLVAFLSSAIDSGEEAHSLDYLSRRNEKILRYCKEAGIGAKQYLPHYKTQEEWREHFGEEGWRRFLRRKMEFDPRRILAPGQGIFHPFGSFSS